MKMKHIIPTIMVLALVVAMAPSAQALCSPPKTFGSWVVSAGFYTYVTGWNQNNAATYGSFWQPGSRLTIYEGTHTDDQWLRYYPGYGGYITGNLGDGGVVGCPGGELIVSMTQDNGNGTASFAIARETEDLAWAHAFQMPNMTFWLMPAPRALTSSRAGETVVMDVLVDPFEEGFFSLTGHGFLPTISGVSLYTFHGAADPGRDTANWTFHSTLPYAGGPTTAVGTVFSCVDDGMDTFVAAAINMNGEMDTLHVGSSIVIECDAALADPDDKFELIRERVNEGRKTFTDR